MIPRELHNKKMPQGMETTNVNKRLQRSPLMQREKHVRISACAMINCSFQLHSLKLQSNALLQEKFVSKLVALLEKIKLFTHLAIMMLLQEIINNHILKIFTCFTATIYRQVDYSSPLQSTLGRRRAFRQKGLRVFRCPLRNVTIMAQEPASPSCHAGKLPINPVRSSHSPSPRWIARVPNSI